MRVTRLFLDHTLNVGERYRLDERVAHHVSKVLRLRANASLVVFNGHGGEYLAHLEQDDRRSMHVRVDEFVDICRESPVAVTLAQGLARGERMDFVIQKGVELGVDRIDPVATKHSAVRLSGERAERRHAHWQNVATHACEQSGRNEIPRIAKLQDFGTWLQGAGEGLRIALDPTSTTLMSDVGNGARAVTVLVGPEGGLSEEELLQAERAGFVRVGFGPRILRTETAALAAIVAVQIRFGDLK
jgi:16S rRNA (uracil1498-N3)-methyltransferase